jgi:hypothetical protein
VEQATSVARARSSADAAEPVAPAAAISPCQPADPDVQPVQMDVDAKFLATHDASDILDPVWWSGDIYGGVAEYERCLRPFSREQRLMFALLWYQSEVNNGGHDQFFYNSTGIVFPDALAALKELNLREGVAILVEAGRRLGDAPSRNRKERQAQLDRLHPHFGDLDDRFYALDRKVNIDSAMTAYMRAHPSAFAFHGIVQIPKSTLEIRKDLAEGK